MEDREVCKIKYLPARYVAQQDGKTKYEGEIWKGLTKTKEGEVVIEVLDQNWLKENFTKEFLKWIKALQGEDRGFVSIPEGDNDAKVDPHLHVELNGPEIIYRQNTMRGFRGCVVLSLCNALHHAGIGLHEDSLIDFAKIMAKKCYGSKQYEMTGYEMIRMLYDEKDLIGNSMRKKWILSKIKKPNQWNPLCNATDNSITVVTMESSDSKRDHSITFWNNLIFDANVPRAITLSKEHLDYCCSTKTRECTFVKVLYGLTLRKR